LLLRLRLLKLLRLLPAPLPTLLPQLPTLLRPPLRSNRFVPTEEPSLRKQRRLFSVLMCRGRHFQSGGVELGNSADR
jgi:hypothetical protein